MVSWRRFRLDVRYALLLLALLAGTAAAWLVHRHLADVEAQLQARHRVETAPVVVADRMLGAGTMLSADAAAVRAVPVAWLPGDALRPEDFDAIAGAPLVRALTAGEVVRWSDLQLGTRSAFSAQLAPGRRAVTIAVDEINSLSGMLEPGDVIDLYVSFEHGGRRVTRLLLGEAGVLATGRQRADARDEAGDGFATVTLEATPADAVRLVAARQQGSIAAMLRRPGDTGAAAAFEGGDLATLLGMPAPAPRPRVVPVIFGDRAPSVMPTLDGESRVVDGLRGFAGDWAHGMDGDAP
ncbi:Flp pilus assembly protein CpaB [Verticiella sediminum]|uniref:Flp pilus assembly protein CpaB n=1 Tax=Verticiella sediminum TaxID=1247510 RepID=A0A556AQ20_9BURK|nr:Flp pilus assembly protein CpaB [Verticiella sediminum]TSH95002.1 Flp pilus assembly protein CpaB [Verticiella sediminum]